MKQKYTLYEAIKDKLSPNTRRKLDSQMRFNELVKARKKKELEGEL